MDYIAAEAKRIAELWRARAQVSFASARRLLTGGDTLGCANRIYYAAYQVCVGACVAHGDAAKFPEGGNNPTHNDLPDLMQNNGDFERRERETIKKYLVQLRDAREDADYRVGKTVGRVRALQIIYAAGAIFRILDIPTERGET